ncbi:MAG: class I tRNA ligase family protein [Jatrophihabitans sp.]|uniref:class I tRNA ligase family protein n=1 Tax=Jatrophihabitans sp. TaxID=1932789 RepID=UPI00390DCD61
MRQVNPSRLTGPPMRLRLGGELLPMVGHVRMYVCGITPYDVTHLGHAATYVWADAAERVLQWHGHTVTVARNVTDVDDVLFAEARRRGESATMLATLQRASFEATMATLQVRTPDLAPSAAQHIGHVIQLAAALLDRDAAYERNGTVYARTAHAAAQAGLDQASALQRAEEYHDNPGDPDKDDPLDIAVWQAAGSDDDVSWPSPWGEGRPGWHAECAAMVLALFGSSVDIHCGGGDLAYPHHACEAALAEAVTGVTPFARAWMRAGIVSVDGAKMAKSTGNLVLVEDLLREHSPGAVRLLLLNRPWGRAWEYDPSALDDAEALLERLYGAASSPGLAPGAAAVPAALLDDLDVSRAVAIALEDGGQAARTLIEILALS